MAILFSLIEKGGQAGEELVHVSGDIGIYRHDEYLKNNAKLRRNMNEEKEEKN